MSVSTPYCQQGLHTHASPQLAFSHLLGVAGWILSLACRHSVVSAHISRCLVLYLPEVTCHSRFQVILPCDINSMMIHGKSLICPGFFLIVRIGMTLSTSLHLSVRSYILCCKTNTTLILTKGCTYIARTSNYRLITFMNIDEKHKQMWLVKR